MVIVTHDARVAAYADRMVMVRDGLVSFDLGTAKPQAPNQVPTQVPAHAQAKAAN